MERYSNSDRRNKGRMDQLYTKFQQIIIYFLNAHIGRYYSDLNEIFLRLFAKQYISHFKTPIPGLKVESKLETIFAISRNCQILAYGLVRWVGRLVGRW